MEEVAPSRPPPTAETSPAITSAGPPVRAKEGPTRLTRCVRAVRSSLWLIPVLCVLAGVPIVLGTLRLDRVSGTPLSDRFSQLAIGPFAATFVVAVLTLREIPGSDTGTVPGVSALLTYQLMLGSLVTLILFVHRSGQTMRATGLIDLVGDRTRDLIEPSFPAAPVAGTDPDVLPAPEPGNAVRVDRAGLVAAARRADCVLELGRECAYLACRPSTTRSALCSAVRDRRTRGNRHGSRPAAGWRPPIGGKRPSWAAPDLMRATPALSPSI